MSRGLLVGGLALALVAGLVGAREAQAQGAPLSVFVFGPGTVFIEPGGKTCDESAPMGCFFTFPAGTPVTISATVPAGSVPGNIADAFGDAQSCAGSTCSFVITQTTNVPVSFDPAFGPFPELTISRDGAGSGQVQADHQTCPPTCAVAYVAGSQVTLQAQPDPGSAFLQYAGACTGPVATCRFALNANAEVTATFRPSATPPTSFPNPAPIMVPESGPSPTYPSTIDVPAPATADLSVALPGRIRKLTVRLTNVTHTYPADLDIALVGPGGQAVMLMSDAGGGFPLSGVTLTFDDAAPVALPGAAPITTGTYKPTNLGAVPDTQFPAPAPPLPYGTSLSVFNGTDPTGTWKLFVRDDLAGDLGAIVGGWSLEIVTGPAIPARFDFDGDGRADAGVYRLTNGMWSLNRSFEASPMQVAFGDVAAGDIPAPGDYDGDGITDFAVYRRSTGEFFGLSSALGVVASFTFGPAVAGDVPVAADYDGDGVDDVALYRPVTGAFFIRRSSDGGVIQACCAPAGSRAITADFDADGKADLAVYIPTTGQFFFLRSSDATIQSFCCADPAAGDQPVVADYDADGKADLAVYRGTTGEFLILRSSDGTLLSLCCASPAAGDVPVVADYDGDGRADPAVYRATTGQFLIFQSATQTLAVTGIGTPALGDVPTVNTFAALPPTPPPPPPANPAPPEPSPTPPDQPPPPAPECKADSETPC